MNRALAAGRAGLLRDATRPSRVKPLAPEKIKQVVADPKPFVWTKSAAQILEKVARAKQALESQRQLPRFPRHLSSLFQPRSSLVAGTCGDDTK